MQAVAISQPSFFGKHGRGGFAMAELCEAAHKVAGLERAMVTHVPGYPEENVYFLINSLLQFEQAKSIDELSVVFVGNRVRKVQLWSMKDCKLGLDIINSGQAMREYHVFLVQSPPPMEEDGERPPSYVWDLDTTLPFPCRLGFYGSHALRAQAHLQLDERLTKQYRVVKADQYLKHFASDRAHMKLSDGSWARPLPPWPAIVNAGGSTSTIAKYFTFNSAQPRDDDYGLVMDELALMHFFAVHLAV